MEQSNLDIKEYRPRPLQSYQSTRAWQDSVQIHMVERLNIKEAIAVVVLYQRRTWTLFCYALVQGKKIGHTPNVDHCFEGYCWRFLKDKNVP